MSNVNMALCVCFGFLASIAVLVFYGAQGGKKMKLTTLEMQWVCWAIGVATGFALALCWKWRPK